MSLGLSCSQESIVLECSEPEQEKRWLGTWPGHGKKLPLSDAFFWTVRPPWWGWSCCRTADAHPKLRLLTTANAVSEAGMVELIEVSMSRQQNRSLGGDLGARIPQAAWGVRGAEPFLGTSQSPTRCFLAEVCSRREPLEPCSVTSYFQISSVFGDRSGMASCHSTERVSVTYRFIHSDVCVCWFLS